MALPLIVLNMLMFAGSFARPSEDLVAPPALKHQGRRLQGGPAQAGCDAAGLSCCYDPNW